MCGQLAGIAGITNIAEALVCEGVGDRDLIEQVLDLCYACLF